MTIRPFRRLCAAQPLAARLWTARRNGPPFAASCRIYRAKAWSISAAATAGFAAAREQGAADVLGLDVSEKMLAKAREMTADAGIEYRRQDLAAAAAAGKLRSGLQLADPALPRGSGRPVHHGLRRAETRRAVHLHRRAPDLHRPGAAGLAERRQRAEIPAGKRLPARRPARFQLAGGRCHQAAPHARQLYQPAGAARVYHPAFERMGPQRAANRR